jgi:hypothetical protein
VFAAQIALLGLVHTANCAVVYTSVGAAAGRVLRARPAAAREADYRLGSDRGSPNHGSTLASKRVMAQIWNNSTVLMGDVLNEVSTLKQHIDGTSSSPAAFSSYAR